MTRKAGDDSWKQCSPVALKPRGEWAELIAPRVKPVWAWSVLMLCTGRGINAQPRLRIAPKLLPTREPVGKLRVPGTAPPPPSQARELTQSHNHGGECGDIAPSDQKG